MYDQSWEKEDIRLQRHQLERDIMLRYLEKYLPARGRILEVGAATGFYTLHLARQGYFVLAIDLAPEMVKGLEKRAFEAGLQNRVKCHAGDARHLSGIPLAYFDAALVMGPLYHLVLREDRLLALEQTFTCLKPGGVVFSAFVSRFGFLGDVIKEIPEAIHFEKELAYLMEHGHDIGRPPVGNFRGYFATMDEIAPLHEEAGFQMITLAGVEPVISADDESYNRLAGETRRLWSDLLLKVSTEPSMVASSRHVLYIGRKPAASVG